MDYSIGITTFSKRYNFIETLIHQIRKFTNKRVIITINGELHSNFDDDYRKKILKLCLSYDNIYPIFFIEQRGLSKMWNTLLIHSDKDNMLLLNDDIEILNGEIFNELNTINEIKLCKINNSFSHFIVNRKLIYDIGWFDERLLGFGEEDGDIVYRLMERGINISNIDVGGIINIVSNVRHDIINGVGKYSKFNRDYMFNEKYKKGNSKISGMFGVNHIKNIEDINTNPLEKFFWDNKIKLYE